MTTPTPPTPGSTPTRSLEKLIVEQNVSATANFNHLLGSGQDLWEDDDEFDQFLATVAKTRSESACP